ncbi:CopD family protein [Parvularcula oceani]|uniref:CopD family protein n=1 Tax=Parvularcula oceani TaxID=1247963 RepID=UPI0004E1A41A|nr:CopD family protein [Parvularcula oceani]
MAWLKALHIIGLLLWGAGLLYLPGLLLQERPEDEAEANRIRYASHFTLTAILAPAAFATIASGTILLFVADALHGWMFVKLAFVSALVGVNIWIARLLRLLDEGHARYGQRWTKPAVGVTAVAIAAILFLVLGEPDLSLSVLPEWVRTPGGLRDYLSSISMPI